MQKLSRSFIALGGLAVLAACGDDVSVTPPTPPAPPTVTAVTVSPAATSIRVGERIILSANVAVNGSGVNTAVTWTTANAAIASVSAAGEVAGVAVGQTTIRATSTANAGVSGSAAVTVTAPANNVQSVVVAPASANLQPGDKLQLAANVTADAGVARTVTWTSSNTAVATVSATGEVTAVTSGSAVITAASTVNNQVTGTSAITVRPPAAATISVKSITQNNNGLLGPVDINNVFGQIDITLNVDPGDRILSKVAVQIDGVEATSQTFGTSALPTTEMGLVAAPSEVVLSVQTGAYNTTTGATNYKNGPRRVTAVLETRSGTSTASAPAASVTQTLIFRNQSGFVGSIVASGNSASDQAGFTWRAGDLTVNALPVFYNDMVEPFAVQTVTSATISLGNGCDPEFGNRTRTAALSGSAWTTTFPNTASSVTGGANTDNVFRYEFNPAAGFPCPNLLARGEVPVISAVLGDGSTLSGSTGGFLNNPYNVSNGNVAVTPDARFAIRLDNRRPSLNNSPFDGVWQNSNTTSPIVRTGNWINDALVLNATSGNVTNRLQLLTRATDLGVSRLADTELTYETRVGTDATTADASSPVTSVAGLAESSANNTYTMRTRVADKLGNVRTASATTGQGTRTFGVDRTAPTIALDSATTTLDSDSTINAAPITAIAIPFVASDNATGGATPSGFFNLAGNPLTTELRRVDFGVTSAGAVSTRFWCPATASFVSTATGCSSWVSSQSYLGPLTTSFNMGGFGTTEGYYRASSVVTDQAGNQSGTQVQNLLYDVSAPAIGGISYPAFLVGGQTVSFTTQANDNVDLGTGSMWLTYAAFVQNFQWPDIAIGTFGSDVFTTSAPLQLQTAFIRSIQLAAGGNAPAAALLPPTNIFASVTDVAGNVVGAPSTAAIPVGSIQLTTPSTNWSAIPFTWTQSAPAAAVVVDRDPGGANSQTVTITARAVGPTGTFQNPFTSRVEFWVQAAAGSMWRRIGVSTSPSVTDNGVTRTWSFSTVWNPESGYTAPVLDFPAAATTGARIIAIGVNAAGDALSTDPGLAASTLVSVLVP